MRIYLLFLFVFFLPLCWPLGTQAQDQAPIVAELFTSEFCPACPPADQLLETLSKEPHIIALGCHVTYFPGKSDLGRATCTQRQFNYVRTLGNKSPFTPQFVFNGIHSAVGIHNSEVTAALTKAATALKNISITQTAPGVFSYQLPHIALKRKAYLWLVIYEGERHVRGRRFVNVVDVMLPLGAWDGQERREVFAPAFKKAHAGFAIYAQDKKTGAILAAGQYRL